MEFLNNILLLFNNPNDLLVSTLNFPLLLIENFIVIALITTIFDNKISTKKSLFFILLSSIVGYLNINLVPTPYNTIFSFIFTTILLYKFLNLGLIKSLFSSIFILSIFCLSSTLISNFYIKVFQLSINDVIKIPIYKILYNIFIDICSLFVILILKVCNFSVIVLDDIGKKNKLELLLNLVFAIFIIMLQNFINVYYIDFLPIAVGLLNFMFLLGYVCLSIYCFIKVMDLCLTSSKLQSLEEYNNDLRVLYDNIKGFKHDFDNILATFGGYIKTNNMAGLKKYYSQLEEDCESSNNLCILSPRVVNNDGVYNLLAKKYHEAISKNIKVHITFLLDLSTLNMKIYEFARILGILIDNAIDACAECDKRIINLVFRNDAKRSRQLVIIENTYKDVNVDTEKIFEKGFSGKQNHTGIGLWQVRNIIKKYDNVNLFTSKTVDLFSQQLEIYY